MAALSCVQVLLLWAGTIALTFYPPTTAVRAPPQCDIKPSSIVQTKPTGLPAQIEAEFPPNCAALSVEYTCSEPGHVNVSLSELEPYTDYTCTGRINNNNNVFMNETLPPVQIRIDCELSISYSHHVTNTSIDLNWTTTSQNCAGVLQNLTELSYSCSFANLFETDTFHIPLPSWNLRGLRAFTEYKCKVQPLYKNKPVSSPTTVTLRTEPGEPDSVSFYLNAPENNAIIVKCYYEPYDFKGPERIFRARLVGHKELNNSECFFVFEDLSYLTNYTIEVVAFNGVFESKPSTKQFKTSYHFSFYLRLIIIPFAAVMPGVATFILRRKLRQISEDETEEKDPVYAEAQPPDGR